MLKITDKALCCGCGVCAQACPVGCIRLESDSEGFLYPKTDEDACIRCGKCERVCPFRTENLREPAQSVKAYLVKNGDEEVRQVSSSGGAFLLLADAVLRDHGVVFGARMEGLTCVHGAAQTASGVRAFCGSKYVQSDSTAVWKQVERELKSGKKVLFTGTPCQVAGLKRFLAKPYENLLCADLICHGTPSPGVFARYCEELTQEYGEVPRALRFRHKERNWQCVTDMLVEKQDGTVVTRKNDAFLLGFLTNLYLRPSCYACRANGNRSGSDLTLADYWGAETLDPKAEDGKGVSLVLTKSKAGEAALHSVQQEGNAMVRPAPLEHALLFNRTLFSSSGMNLGRSAFFEELEHSDAAFEKVVKKYCRPRNAPKTWLAIRVKRLFGYRFYNRLWMLAFGRGIGKHDIGGNSVL